MYRLKVPLRANAAINPCLYVYVLMVKVGGGISWQNYYVVITTFPAKHLCNESRKVGKGNKTPCDNDPSQRGRRKHIVDLKSEGMRLQSLWFCFVLFVRPWGAISGAVVLSPFDFYVKMCFYFYCCC